VTTSRDAGDDLLRILDELDDLISNEAGLPELAAAVERQHLIYQQLFGS